ncbi:cytochrome P450 [Apodospora peruviana]|uniref:Cytochrome P450 n=1 Tax=Apodospora peruviana TaxID=516989 RepID=A0AAE0HX24_9PEZI|nr:cytochrome P450 [Apodospora peruviana]
MAYNTLAVVCLAAIGYVILRFRQQRKLFKNLPGPPHHPIWGHLPVMAGVARSLPPDADPQSYAHHIRNKYGLGDFFYLDMWPLAPPQLVIVEPELAAQIAQGKATFDKGDMVRQYLEPLVGKKAMVAANGHDWKISRRLFAPGLLHRNLLQHVPDCVDDTLKFRDELAKHAERGDIFPLESLCARLVFNIATRIILGVDCNAVQHDHMFMTLFLRQAQLQPVAFWARYFTHPNPMVHYRRWVNRRGLHTFIGGVIDDRYSSLGSVYDGEKTTASGKKHSAVIDYALDGHREALKESRATAAGSLDQETRDNLITQVKTLIFAGHDSSSSTISFAFYLLSRNPCAATKLRAELDRVLGPSISDTVRILKRDPSIINQLSYTHAVIQETLRLLPPIVGSYRFGRKDVSLVHEGKSWPTYPFAVFINNHAMMRRPDIFRDPDAFRPERYLITDISDEHFVPKNAWRGFEKGSRNCIGDAMALIQIKLVLALTVREFSFKEEYPDTSPEVDGEKMYVAFHVTAKPALGMPGRVMRVAPKKGEEE